MLLDLSCWGFRVQRAIKLAHPLTTMTTAALTNVTVLHVQTSAHAEGASAQGLEHTQVAGTLPYMTRLNLIKGHGQNVI